MALYRLKRAYPSPLFVTVQALILVKACEGGIRLYTDNRGKRLRDVFLLQLQCVGLGADR